MMQTTTQGEEEVELTVHLSMEEGDPASMRVDAVYTANNERVFAHHGGVAALFEGAAVFSSVVPPTVWPEAADDLSDLSSSGSSDSGFGMYLPPPPPKTTASSSTRPPSDGLVSKVCTFLQSMKKRSNQRKQEEVDRVLESFRSLHNNEYYEDVLGGVRIPVDDSEDDGFLEKMRQIVPESKKEPPLKPKENPPRQDAADIINPNSDGRYPEPVIKSPTGNRPAKAKAPDKQEETKPKFGDDSDDEHVMGTPRVNRVDPNLLRLG